MFTCASLAGSKGKTPRYVRTVLYLLYNNSIIYNRRIMPGKLLYGGGGVITATMESRISTRQIGKIVMNIQQLFSECVVISQKSMT